MATLTLGTIFKGEAAQLISEIGRVKTALKDIVGQFNAINTGASKISAAFQSVQAASSKGAEALTEYDKALDRIGKSGTKLNALNAITKGIEKNSKVFPLAAKAIRQVDVALGRLSADYKNYLTQIKGVAAGTKEFNKEMGKLRPSLTTGQRGSILAAASFDRFRGALDNSKEALAKWLTQQTKATQNFKDFSKSVNLPLVGVQKLDQAFKRGILRATTYASAVKKLQAAEQAEAKVKSEVLGSQEKLTRSTQTASKVASKHATILGSLVQRVRNLVEYATASTAVYGFINAIRSGVTEIIEFSQALKNLEAITLTENFGEILAAAEEIKRIAQTTKFSVTELGTGMVVLAQTGYNAVQSLELINAVGKLSAATLSGLSTVTDLLTSTMRAFAKEAHQAGTVSDTMANAINLSKLTIDKLRIAFNYIGVAAKQAGIKLREVVTVFALLANSGLRASTMATGLRQVISKMINPTQKVRAALEGLGVPIDALNPKLTDFRTVLLNLTSVLWDNEKQTVDMAKAYKIFQLRGAQAAAAIATAFKAGEYDQMLEKMSRIGTSGKMAAIQLEGLSAKLKRLADTAKLVMVTLGDAGFTAVLHGMVDGLKGLTDSMIAFLESGLGKIVTQMALLVVGSKAVVKAFAILKAGVTALITSFTFFIATVNTVAMTMGKAKATGFAFSKALSAIGGPAVAIITSLGTLILLFKHYAEASRKAAVEASKTSIQLIRQADALKNTASLLETLWGKGKTSDYSEVIRQLASEYPKLAERIAELGGVADIASLSFEKLMAAMRQATQEFTWKGVEEGIESFKKFGKAVSEAQYWEKQQAPWANYFTGFKEAAQESVEDYKASLNTLVKTLTRLKIEGRISGVEINKKLQETGIRADEAVEIMSKLRRELKLAADAAAGIELKRFQTSFQALSIEYRDLYNHLDASRKAEFIKFQATLDAKVAMVKKYGKDYAFSEEETNQAIAALRAREMADWMLANNERLEGKKDSEEAAIQIVESFLQKTVQFYRKGAIDRQQAEGEFVGYTEVINRKYLDGIKRVYGEVTKIVGSHLSKLRSQMDETLAGIERVTSEIVDANKSYYADIRDLQQKTMTDEQRWLDDRKEANRLLNEGIKSQSADTLKEAQSLFKSLARDVTDDSGKTVRDIEDTAKAAQAGVSESHKALVSVLEGQKNQFQKNIDIIKSEIEKAEKYLDHYKKKIEEVSSEPFRLNTSDLKATLNTLAADLENFKNQISEKPVEFNVVFTGEGSDKKFITEKISEVKEKVDDAATEINKKEATVTVDFRTEFGQKAEEAAKELPGKISAAIVTTPVTIPLVVDSDPGVFETGISKIKEFAVSSAEAAKKVTGAFSYMRDKVFSASNIFKVVFFGDDAELGGGDSLIDKTKQVMGTLRNASENISNLKTTFTTILQSGDGVELSKKAQAIVDNFKASSKTINALRTSFTAIFRTDDNVPLKQAFLDTMRNALDLSLNIKSINTNFEMMFEDDNGMPLSDRFYEIASQSADLSDFIGGLVTTFKTDFLTNEGLSITSQFDKTAKAANTLANLVNDITSVFMVNFQGKGSTERPITEKIGEVTGQIKSFASNISRSTANFVTNFINDEGVSFSKIGDWIKDKLGVITKFINNSESSFITAFKTDEGFSLGKMISWILEKFGFVSSFINNLKSIFSISFLSDDGLTFKDKMVLLKDKLKTMAGFIGETVAVFKTKFTDESGKFSFSVMVESAKKEILNLWKIISESTAQFTTEFVTGDGAPLKPAFEWLSEKFKWLKDLITGFAAKFVTGFEDTEGKPVTGTLTIIADMISNLIKIIGQSVTTFVTKLTDGEGNPLSDAFTGASNLAKDTSSSIRGMSTLFKVFVTDKDEMPLGDKLKATVGSVQKVKDTINGMKTGLKIAVTADEVGLPVPEKMEGIVKVIRKTSEIISKAKAWFNIKFSGGTKDEPVEQAIAKIEKNIENLAKKTETVEPKAKIAESFDKAGDSLARASEIADDFKNRIIGMTDGLDFSGVFDKTASLVKESSIIVLSQIENLKNEIGNLSAVFNINIMGTASETKPFTEKLFEIWDGIVEFAKNVADYTIELIIDIKNYGGEKLEEIKEKWEDFKFDFEIRFGNEEAINNTIKRWKEGIAAAFSIKEAGLGSQLSKSTNLALTAIQKISNIINKIKAAFVISFTGSAPERLPIAEEVNRVLDVIGKVIIFINNLKDKLSISFTGFDIIIEDAREFSDILFKTSLSINKAKKELEKLNKGAGAQNIALLETNFKKFNEVLEKLGIKKIDALAIAFKELEDSIGGMKEYDALGMNFNALALDAGYVQDKIRGLNDIFLKNKKVLWDTSELTKGVNDALVVMAHEGGHHILNQHKELQISVQQTYDSVLKNGKFATNRMKDNFHEFFAESHALFAMGMRDLIDPRLLDIFDQMYKKIEQPFKIKVDKKTIKQMEANLKDIEEKVNNIDISGGTVVFSKEVSKWQKILKGYSIDANQYMDKTNNLNKKIEESKPKYDIQFVSGSKTAEEVYAKMTDSTADLRTRIGAGLSLFRIAFTGSDGSEGMESTSVKDQVQLLRKNLEFLSKSIERTETGYKIIFGTGENKTVSERVAETLGKIKTSARLINNINAFYRVGLTVEDEKGNPLADLSDTVKKVSDVAAAIGEKSAEFKTFITDGKGKPLGDALRTTQKIAGKTGQAIEDYSPEFAVNFVTGRGKSLSERWKDVEKAGRDVSKEVDKLKTQFRVDFLSDEKKPLIEAILNTGYRLRRLAEEITGNFRAKMTFFFVGDKGKDILTSMNEIHDKFQGFWTGVQKLFFKNSKKLVVKILGEKNKPLSDSLVAALDMVKIWGETMNKRGHGFIRWLMLGKDLKEGPLSETLTSSKNLIDSTMDYISKKKAKMTIWLTGKGSSEKPITEKLKEIDGEVDKLSGRIEGTSPKLVTEFAGPGDKPISVAFDELVKSFYNVGDRISYAWSEWSTRVVENTHILTRGIRVLTLSALTKLSGVIGPVTASFKGFTTILKGVFNMSSPVFKILSKFGPMLLKIGGAFNVVSAALATFLAGWDMGQVINDMDLFGLLPMKVKNYVQKIIASLDSLLKFTKGTFLIIGKALAEKLGFESAAKAADSALSKIENDMDKIKDTFDDIQPIKVKVEDDGAVAGAVKIKRSLTEILGEAGSETINYYKTVFTGKINPEGPLLEIVDKAKSAIEVYDETLKQGGIHFTNFRGKIDKKEMDFGQATLQMVKKYAEASAKIAKEAQSKSAVFVAKFSIKTTGPMDSPERMTQSMYNTWSDFYNKLDGLRKISFKKFWQDTQNQVSSYDTAAKEMQVSEEERAVDIQRIREEAFAKFRATAEKEMNAVSSTSLISIVETIGKKTAEITAESAERIAAYEDEIKDLERLQIEADTVFQKSQAKEPAAPTWKGLNQSVGVLSDLSEREIAVLRAAHQEKVGLYQSSLSSEQAFQKGKEAFNSALNQSVGEYATFSQAEIDAIRKSNEDKAELFKEGSKLYEQSYDLEAAKTSADKIRDIQLKIARERVEAIRKSLNLSIALLDDHTQREVATVKRGLAEKHKYNMENVESVKKMDSELVQSQTERLSKSEKLELEYQVERAKFWGMNVEKMKGQEAALIGIMEASVNARKRLDEDAAGSAEKANAQILDSRKKALSEEEKIDLQYHIDRAKFWGMNVELAKTKHVDLTRVLENAVGARKKLEQDAALESVQIEQNKAQVISQVATETSTKTQAVTKQQLEAERVVAKETESINREVYKKKKEYYEKARDALKQSLDEARNIEKSIAQEIQSVYESMAESQKSTEEKIRDIRRGRMSEEQAYQDQWKEVEEIIARADEMDASRMEEKIALYKKAQDKVAGLNKEVKAGEQVVVDKGAASIKVENKLIEVEKKIQEGYKTRAKVLEEQQKQAQKDIKVTKATLEEMNKTITDITAETKKIEIELNEPEVSEAINRIQAEIDAIEGKTVTIKVEKEEGYATGGRVGYATGGRVFGGGHSPGIDTVPANLTIDEFVHPVSATKKFGFGFMEFIRQKIPPVENVRLLMAAGTRKLKDVLKSGVQKFNSGGPVMAKTFSGIKPVITINPTMPGLDFKGINSSIVQNYVAGGPVAMPDMQHFGTFSMVGPGGARIENAVAQVNALEMFKEAWNQENKRRVNG